jgi:hypothetical protein
MKLSAARTLGKCRPLKRRSGKLAGRMSVTAASALRGGALALLLLCAMPGNGWSKIPLPRPRPSQAPAQTPAQAPTAQVPAKTPPDQSPPAEDAGKTTDKPTDKAADAKPPPPSPCRLALTDLIAVAPSIAPIRGPGACGGEDLVRLEAVVLSGGEHVAVKPPATLRCTMASAVADWIRKDIAPLVQQLGSGLSEVDNFDSYECRGRNRVVGAKLSEHGLANALDVRGLKLASGRFVSLTDRAESHDLREQVLRTVCPRFTTVLGPGSDWYHEDHIHLDLAERHGGYRLCQWNVYDPLPAVAPLLPAERPTEAPPRPAVTGADKDAPARQSVEPYSPATEK